MPGRLLLSARHGLSVEISSVAPEVLPGVRARESALPESYQAELRRETG